MFYLTGLGNLRMIHIMKPLTVLRGAIVATALALSSVSAWALKVDVTVNKMSQKMTVVVDGHEEYVWLVSTGGVGYDTPIGSYHVFRLEKEHFSKEWDDAPMPYSMFFTPLGHAIHGSFHTKALGRRASHGCVRLAPENAAILFDLVQKAGYKNSTINIKNGGFFDFGAPVALAQPPSRPFFLFGNPYAKPLKPVKVLKVDLRIKKSLKKKKQGFSLFSQQ
jgi:L,D-transpeptidase catalytic domain